MNRSAPNSRNDIDLFALGGSLAWLGEHPKFASRADHLFAAIASAILTNPAP